MRGFERRRESIAALAIAGGVAGGTVSAAGHTIHEGFKEGRKRCDEALEKATHEVGGNIKIESGGADGKRDFTVHEKKLHSGKGRVKKLLTETNGETFLNELHGIADG